MVYVSYGFSCNAFIVSTYKYQAQMKSRAQEHAVEIENIMMELSGLQDTTDFCKEIALNRPPKEMYQPNDKADSGTKVCKFKIWYFKL